jgi:hypothetical protein
MTHILISPLSYINIKQNSALLLILFLAFFVRLMALTVYHQSEYVVSLVEGRDAAGYIQLANALFQSGSYHFADGKATAFRMPGYPLFLLISAVPWPSPVGAQLIQIVIDIVTILLTYQFAFLLGKQARVGVAAAILVAFHPLLVLSSITLLPETLAMGIITGSALLILQSPPSRWVTVALGLLLSLGIYLKPTLFAVAVIFLVLFGLKSIINRQPPSLAVGWLLAPLIVMVTLTPWAVRNWMIMQAFIPLTTSNGSNLYGGNNAQANGGYVSDKPYVLPGMSEVASNRILTERAWAWIQTNPTRFLQLLPAKAARFLWPLSLGTSGTVAAPAIVMLVLLIVLFIFYSFVVYGAFQLAATKQFWALAILGASPITLLLLTLLSFGATRFLLPAFPAIAVLAALGIEAMASVLVYQRQAL